MAHFLEYSAAVAVALLAQLRCFEFDFAEGAESVLIKIELTLDNETLKGSWFDPDGNSDIIELTLKK